MARKDNNKIYPKGSMEREEQDRKEEEKKYKRMKRVDTLEKLVIGTGILLASPFVLAIGVGAAAGAIALSPFVVPTYIGVKLYRHEDIF